MTSFRMKIFSGFGFLILMCVFSPAELTVEGTQRIRPPEKITCSRDHLTSYTGKVLSMKRQRGSTRIRMRTDEETSEQFTLRHLNDNPSECFLIWGEKFSEKDWSRIETGKNQLRANLRATVWVCDNGENPIVDWQPVKN